MRLPLRSFLLLGAALATLAVAPPALAADPPPRRVLIISIDGLAPHVLRTVEAPVIRGLMARGAHSFEARTTALCNTLPSHTSMLTGVPPEVHGVTWNGDLRGERRYPNRPTLFELARAAGFTTAMAAGKTKFVTLAKPGTLDWSVISRTKDAIVTDRAADLIRAHAPQVLFVHLPGVDHAGHAWGWGSAIQRGAIAAADRCVGRLLDALRDRGVLDSTVVFVTADHGGVGRSHPASDPRSRIIPWIVSGAGIRAGLDLSGTPIGTEDTFATACWLLGIAPPDSIQGLPVRSILLPKPEDEPAKSRAAPIRG